LKSGFLHEGLVTLSIVVATGCASSRPHWTTEVPSGFQYGYVVGVGEGESEVEALQQAALHAREQVASANALVTVTVTTRQTSIDSGGAVQRVASVDTDMQTRGLPRFIEGWQFVELYMDPPRRDADYTLWALYRHDLGPRARKPPGRITFVIKSMILPGWGQRAKRARGRSKLFTYAYLGEWSAWGALGLLRNVEIRREARAETAPEQSDAIRKANLYGDIRNGVLAGIAATWVISLFDAFSAEPSFLAFRLDGIESEGRYTLGLVLPF